ncbi:MAG: hypothetical protein EOO46_20510 [Flavobacterium sp.]|nr:MAG: hypothetical protein EOO46_20510 [Flavobacterium sp.]
MEKFRPLILLLLFNSQMYMPIQIDFIKIDDLFGLKNSSDERINDYLILNDWIFIKNKSDGSRKSIVGVETEEKIYSSPGNSIQLTLQNKFTFQKKDGIFEISRKMRSLSLFTLTSEQNKHILKSIYDAGFEVGKEQQLGNIEIANSQPKDFAEKIEREFVNTQTMTKTYTKGENKIDMTIKVYEKVLKGERISRTSYNFTFHL